jgi:branched-subunit amino acid permease
LEALKVANDLNYKVEKARRYFLPIGAVILLFLILLPALNARSSNLPLVIALAIFSLTFLALSVILYYMPHLCVTEGGKWLPPFNVAVVSTLFFTIILWALTNFNHEVRASMAMALLAIAAFFSMSKGTYLWEIQGP